MSIFNSYKLVNQIKTNHVRTRNDERGTNIPKYTKYTKASGIGTNVIGANENRTNSSRYVILTKLTQQMFLEQIKKL
jgi:hypothetical protein